MGCVSRAWEFAGPYEGCCREYFDKLRGKPWVLVLLSLLAMMPGTRHASETYWGLVGNKGICRGNIGRMEKKMEATTVS